MRDTLRNPDPPSESERSSLKDPPLEDEVEHNIILHYYSLCILRIVINVSMFKKKISTHRDSPIPRSPEGCQLRIEEVCRVGGTRHEHHGAPHITGTHVIHVPNLGEI